jgi:CBS-domain-containing membrane protein
MQQWTVRDVMTSQVLTVAADAGPAEVISLMTAHDVSALAVADDHDVVIGVLTRTDVLNSMSWSATPPPGGRPWRRRARPELTWHRATARQMMTAPPLTVGPEASLPAAGDLMRREGVKRLLVVDHRRRLLGVVAAADLLTALRRTDEPGVRGASEALMSGTGEGAVTASRPRGELPNPWWPAQRRSRVPSSVH